MPSGPRGIAAIHGKPVMKITATACLFAVSLLATSPVGPAFANADDDAWIAKCVGDNAEQGQTAETVAV
jgi:hypothetical protein